MFYNRHSVIQGTECQIKEMKTIAKIYFILVLLLGCGAPDSEEQSAEVTTKDSVVSVPKEKLKSTSSDLSVFENGEIISYCILLPLNDFTEVFDDSTEKAQHKFVPKKKTGKLEQLEVQGYIIDTENAGKAEAFYNANLTDIESGGLAIDTSYVTKNFYSIKGYLPNDSDMKFIEIAWVNEDKIKLSILFHKSRQVFWENLLKQIIIKGIKCD